jgi:hypothetical protein
MGEIGAKVLVSSAIEMLKEPRFIAEVKAEFENKKKDAPRRASHPARCETTY